MLTPLTGLEYRNVGFSMPPSAAGSIVVSNLNTEKPLPPAQTA